MTFSFLLLIHRTANFEIDIFFQVRCGSLRGHTNSVCAASDPRLALAARFVNAVVGC
jgi:hypothetical protein